MANPPTSARGAVTEDGTLGWSWFDWIDVIPELRWPGALDVYHQMRREPQLKSLLTAVKLPIKRTQWRLDGSGCRPEVAEMVASNVGLPLVGDAAFRRPVRSRDRFSWQNHLSLAMTSFDFGHSFFEPIYRYEQGRFLLRKLEWRPPQTISKVSVASDGGLVSISQNLPGTKPIPVERLVAYINDREGGNWLGESMLRPSYRSYWLKDRLQRVQVLSIERNGMGVPVVTAPERDVVDDPDGAKAQADIDNGLDIVRRFRSGEEAGVSLPAGSKIQLLGVEGTLPDADKPIRYHDEQMARSFLGHFLNLGTETGSWALGSTFADFFSLALQAKAEEIADVATQHIVEDLVDINWGPEEPAPRVTFDEIGSQSQVTAEALKTLVDAGILTPDEPTETFARTRWRLPARDASTERTTKA